MKLSISSVAVVAITALTAVTSSAQNMRPGLWEINNKMQSGNGQLELAMGLMQQQMENMGAEQRKMMDDMMAKRGVNLSGMGNGGVTVKMCMTKEMVAQNQIPVQQQGDCTHTRSPVVGKTMKVAFRCTRPDARGEGQVTFAGDAAYTMKMKMSANVGGRAETMNVDAHARWLGADCGNIEPVAMPAAK